MHPPAVKGSQLVKRTHLTRFHILSLVSLLALLLAACAGKAAETELSMAPIEHMPPEVQSAPVVVREAYQFAVANPELMQELPCYCGCGPVGHTSNYSCYVSGVDSEGSITFDTHALGCSICVDITQDAMRMTREGKTLEEIRSAIDATYSAFGPSNIP
jgi:hypothetical protein